MLELITAIDLYEMTNLRLKFGVTKDLMAKRKPALMVETKQKLKELTKLEMNAAPTLFLHSRI